MSVTPTEGQLGQASLVYKGNVRAANMELGLWAGTWSEEYDVTYNEASARFTKLAGNGADAVTLDDSNVIITAVGDTVTVTWPAELFNLTGTVTVNGYYIAIDVGGAMTLETVERDPTERNFTAGESYTVTPNITLKDNV